MNFATKTSENSFECKTMLGKKMIHSMNISNPIRSKSRVKKSLRHKVNPLSTFSYPSKYNEFLCQDGLNFSFVTTSTKQFKAAKEQSEKDETFIEGLMKNLEAFQVYQLSENILSEEKLNETTFENLPYELDDRKYGANLTRKSILKRRKLQECQ